MYRELEGTDTIKGVLKAKVRGGETVAEVVCSAPASDLTIAT